MRRYDVAYIRPGNQRLLGHIGFALCMSLTLGSFSVHAGKLFDFYASDWSGPNNAWTSRTGSQTLFYDTFNGSAPQKGSAIIGGVIVDTAVFDGNDFLTTPLNQSNRPWAGLSEFSISIVFRSNTDTGSSESDINAFWNHEGIIGFEVGGAGQGEFGIGLYNDGTTNGAVAAGTGLAATDEGTSGGNINDNAWHTLTLVVKNLGGGSFSQAVYVDGGLVNEDSPLSYGGGASTLANQSFSLGNIRLGGVNSNPFTGAVAALRFDDAALQISEISDLHSTYLGLVPNTNQTVLIFGSSVAKGWNGNGSITNGSFEFGFAGRLTPVLEATGWTVTNGSIPGNNTASLLARFDTDAVPVNPDIIVIGLSLANEGLLGDSGAAYESFRSGMSNLIYRSRANGFYPVINHAYPHTAYNSNHYAYVKRMNLLLNSWDVPGVNMLGATDDGTGKWVTAYRSDDAHPNADGHALMFEAIVPSLFDAIRAGKTNTPSLDGAHGFTRVQSAEPRPITFTPAQPIRSFNVAFRVRATSTGTVAAVLTETNAPVAGGAIELRGDSLVYIATNGAEIAAPVDADAGRWIDVALSHSYARGLTLLYVYGVPAGTTPEHLAPAQFVLGGPGGLTARPPAPASLDLQDWCVYRGPWTPEEAMAQHTGALQQASMEIGAPLNDPAFTLGASATNHAQSLSLASISGTNLTAGPIDLPPGDLEASSPAFNTVALTWTDASATETGFVIERRPADGTSFWSNLVTLAANTTSHTDTNLPAGAYQYRVASVEGALLSEYSAIAVAAVTNAPVTDPTISYREWASGHFALAPDTYRIDFNTNPAADYGTQLWNTVTSLTATAAYRLTSAATTDVGVTIAVTDDFSDFRSDNGAPLAEFDNDPQKSYFGINAAGAQVLLSNLNRNATYDAVVFARRGVTFPGFDYRTVFTFTGGGADVGFTVDAASNLAPVRVFGLAPDGVRTLALDVRGPAAPTGTAFGGINFLVLRELNGPGPFLIDFNTAANPVYPTGETWNTINSLTNNIPYLLADRNGDTSAGYTFTLDDGFDQFRSDNGDLIAGFSGTAENSSFALRDDVPLLARMTIAGLDTNLLYDITFLARRGSLFSGFDYSGIYTFTGAVTTVVHLNSATNTTYADLSGLAPDDNGRIGLTITAVSSGLTNFPVLNLLRLTSAGPRTGSPLAGPYEQSSGNGLPNLLAYGQNLAPVNTASLTLANPAIQSATGLISIYYDRNAFTHQIDYALESTTNLITGLWNYDLAATESIFATNGTNQTIRLQRLITGPDLYLRLAAEFKP